MKRKRRSSTGNVNKTKITCSFTTPKGFNYKELVSNIKKRNTFHSLYPNWRLQLNDIRLLSDTEYESYLPQCSESMVYSHKQQEGSSISLFKGSKDHLIFVGGPVWSMDWAPISNRGCRCSYVAMANYRTYNEVHVTDAVLSHEGLIQLWNAGQLTNNASSDPGLQFCFAIAHSWGCIREMRWCPSGVQDSPTSTTTSDEGFLQRLGLLAVACSDGQARILSVPYPESLSSLLPHSDSARPIFSLHKLAVILRPGSFQSEDSGCGQCLCIQWLPSEGHCRIAAGFSNGIVCVWSLEGLGFLQHASVPLEQGPVLYPIIHLRGHIGPVRCLAWCPRDTKYLFSGGADKWCFIWDLRQPTSPPVQRASRNGIVTRAVWPLAWPGIFIVEDFVKTSSLILLNFSRTGVTSLTFTKTPSPISSIGYSAESDRLILGTYSGEVFQATAKAQCYSHVSKRKSVAAVGMLTAKLRKVQEEEEEKEEGLQYGIDNLSDIITNYQMIFTNDSKGDSKDSYKPEVIPITAVTSCVWSPSNDRWGLCAFNNGFVKLIKSCR